MTSKPIEGTEWPKQTDIDYKTKPMSSPINNLAPLCWYLTWSRLKLGGGGDYPLPPRSIGPKADDDMAVHFHHRKRAEQCNRACKTQQICYGRSSHRWEGVFKGGKERGSWEFGIFWRILRPFWEGTKVILFKFTIFIYLCNAPQHAHLDWHRVVILKSWSKTILS